MSGLGSGGRETRCRYGHVPDGDVSSAATALGLS